MGTKVVIADVPDERGEALAGEVGAGSLYVPTDCMDEDAIAKAVKAAADRGPLRAAVITHIGPDSDGLEPSTPSLPWRFRTVTRIHARSSATLFLLQIAVIRRRGMRREASRVSFLMCPFCARELLTRPTTDSLA